MGLDAKSKPMGMSSCWVGVLAKDDYFHFVKRGKLQGLEDVLSPRQELFVTM